MGKGLPFKILLTLRPRRSSSLWIAMELTHLLMPPSLQHNKTALDEPSGAIQH